MTTKSDHPQRELCGTRRSRCLADRCLPACRTAGGNALDFPGYREFYDVADDCQTLAVIYYGANLLNLDDRDPSTVVVTFYEGAREVRKITLGEIYPDLAVLPRTVGHWARYWSAGWVGKDWMIKTVDGRTLTFNTHLQR